SDQTTAPNEAESDNDDWHSSGPIGSSAFSLQAALVRLYWCAIYPAKGLRGIPQGWFHYRQPEPILIRCQRQQQATLHAASLGITELFNGNPEPLCSWIQERTSEVSHPFEVAVLKEDLEFLSEFAAMQQKRLAL